MKPDVVDLHLRTLANTLAAAVKAGEDATPEDLSRMRSQILGDLRDQGALAKALLLCAHPEVAGLSADHAAQVVAGRARTAEAGNAMATWLYTERMLSCFHEARRTTPFPRVQLALMYQGAYRSPWPVA